MTSRLVALGCCLVLSGATAAAQPTPAAPAPAPASSAAAAPVQAPSPAAAVRYSAPVSPVRVVRGFDPPPTPYAAGHRGVDLATAAGDAVRAAGTGTVGFAGEVAGRGVVVIVHPDGLRTEYEPLDVRVRAGQPVVRGELIGTVAGTHGDCPSGGCLHWGARRGDGYLDPLTLLRPLGPVRLLPWR